MDKWTNRGKVKALPYSRILTNKYTWTMELENGHLVTITVITILGKNQH